MVNADDLRRLAQEVADAYEDRVNCINTIKAETANLLDYFDDAHQKMADNLRAELAKFKADLDAAESERKEADQAEVRERRDAIIKLLSDFDNAHNEMSDALRAELAKFKADLDAAEGERRKADQDEIRERGVYIENLLGDFDDAHQKMADNLRAELAKFKADLDAAESERKEADQAEVRERRDAIIKLLSDFDNAHNEMSDALRAELAKVKPELEAAEGERRENVSNMLDQFRKEQEETSAAWKDLLAGMASLRGKVTITAPAEARPGEEAIEEEEIEEEEHEYEDLRNQILDVLDDNPDGLRMVEIADIVGIPSWRSLIPVMRELLDEGDVTKEDSTYYIA